MRRKWRKLRKPWKTAPQAKLFSIFTKFFCKKSRFLKEFIFCFAVRTCGLWVPCPLHVKPTCTVETWTVKVINQKVWCVILLASVVSCCDHVLISSSICWWIKLAEQKGDSLLWCTDWNRLLKAVVCPDHAISREMGGGVELLTEVLPSGIYPIPESSRKRLGLKFSALSPVTSSDLSQPVLPQLRIFSSCANYWNEWSAHIDCNVSVTYG